MSALAAFAWGVGTGGFTAGFGMLVAAHAAADFLNRCHPATPDDVKVRHVWRPFPSSPEVPGG